MRGLMVVGTRLNAGEAPIAGAVAHAAGPDAHVYAVAPDLHTATPMIAARHRGETFDPADLVARAQAHSGGGFLVASAPGGLLAPLTPRYAVRDLARDLGLPLVLCAQAGPGVVNDVRLSLAAARSAGLAVAAVVLTGWPDPPNRIQLDEQELLAELAGVEVLVHPTQREWPVQEWADAVPAAPAASPAAEAADAPEPLTLDPYETWRPRNVGDPRGTPRPQIMAALLEIVAAEGPVTASRAYSIYNKASGGKKLTSVARAPLSSSAYWLAKEEKLHITRESEIPWQGDDVLRLPDTPEVRVRELGPRTLEEVPLDEIAELIRRLRASQGVEGDAETKRAVLKTYGLKRLTTRADEYLGLALDLARS